jgi:hypothetical protein
MLADFLTKPLQGNLFRQFHRVLLGYEHNSYLDTLKSDTTNPEECVEKNKIMRLNISEVQDSVVHDDYKLMSIKKSMQKVLLS